MSNKITVRLPDDLGEWLDAPSRKAGVSRSRIVRDQLQFARIQEKRSFLRLAGSVDGPRDLSMSKRVSLRHDRAVEVASRIDRALLTCDDVLAEPNLRNVMRTASRFSPIFVSSGSAN